MELLSLCASAALLRGQAFGFIYRWSWEGEESCVISKEVSPSTSMLQLGYKADNWAGDLSLPRAIWRLVTSFMGHTNFQLEN